MSSESRGGGAADWSSSSWATLRVWHSPADMVVLVVYCSGGLSQSVLVGWQPREGGRRRWRSVRRCCCVSEDDDCNPLLYPI